MRCVPLKEEPSATIRRYLSDPNTGWSIGTYGATGEFEYDAGEPGLEIDVEAMLVKTARGALTVTTLEHVQPFSLIDDDGRVREIAFCTTQGGARRTTVTRVDDVTFDVGIGAPHVDMLVRVNPDDLETIAALCLGIGHSLFAPNNPAGRAIARSSPTRVLASALARLEVHQPIPLPCDRSAIGPHVHVALGRLAEGRIHPPWSPLPADLYCCLSLYPRSFR